MHISSFLCTSQTHVRIYYHADIMFITVYCVSHTHTHTNANTHTHTHSLPLSIASASVYRTRAVLDYMRDRPQCISGVAPHRRQHLLAEFQEALQRLFFCLPTHTHRERDCKTRCKFHASQNAYVLHVHACNKRH